MANDVLNNLGSSYSNYLNGVATQMGISIQLVVLVITLISLWTLIWKGLALWKAAGKKQKLWFVILLVLNDLGILEILYYFFFSNLDSKKKASSQKK
jgi:hypothetical protein